LEEALNLSSDRILNEGMNDQRTGTHVRSRFLEEENYLPAYNYLSLKQRKYFKAVKVKEFVRFNPPLLH
jgi:hypothetical protein